MLKLCESLDNIIAIIGAFLAGAFITIIGHTIGWTLEHPTAGKLIGFLLFIWLFVL